MASTDAISKELHPAFSMASEISEQHMEIGWILIGLFLLNGIFLLVLKPFLTTYAEEKGRRLATHEDVEKVLQEVRMVTKETETLKAQISGELWERQNRWNAKRDIYIRLLENLELLKTALARAQYSRTILSDVAAINRAFDEADVQAKDFRKAMAIARLFADPAVETAWNKLSALDVFFGDLQQDAGKRIEKYLTAYEELTQDLLGGCKKFCVNGHHTTNHQ